MVCSHLPTSHKHLENHYHVIITCALRQNNFTAWTVRVFAVEIWNHQKYFFRSTAKLDCPKRKFLIQNVQLQCREKNPLKTHLWKQNATKIHFSTWNFFRSKIFIFWMKRKADPEISNNLNRESHEKIVLKRG